MKKKRKIQRKIQSLFRIHVHTFRAKNLCSSKTYRAALEQAGKEMAADPRYSVREVMDSLSTGINLPGLHLRGFFYEEMPLCESTGNATANHRGGAGMFHAANRRYRDAAWNAGKEPK